jgi:hypothetical protein
VETPAVVLDRHDERVEILPDRQVRRHQRRLHGAYAVHQHLEIMHATEQILTALERAQIGCGDAGADFPQQLDGVAQLLHRNADRMQALRQIDGARLLHHLRKARRTPGHPCLDGPAPVARRRLR